MPVNYLLNKADQSAAHVIEMAAMRGALHGICAIFVLAQQTFSIVDMIVIRRAFVGFA